MVLKWRDGDCSPRHARRAQLTAAIGQIFAARHGKYGSPRITDDLREEFELRDLERFATKAQARARVAAWIDEYNRDRKHSSIGMRSPIDYELTLRERPAAHTAGGRGMTPAPGATMIVPSSPASRPRPPGGYGQP